MRTVLTAKVGAHMRISGPEMSLGDEVKSENNTLFSIQICRGYNNVANTFR